MAAGRRAAAAAKPTCKLHGKACCDPAIEAHLPKEAVYTACGESEATYLGQEAQRETCKYFFKVEGAAEPETFVQVYAPQQKEVLPAPTISSTVEEGRQGVHHRQGEVAQGGADGRTATRLYLPGKGYSVSVNASTKVCTRTEAANLAPSMK